MISNLLYLTTNRPNIMYVICLCAQFQFSPKESHLVSLGTFFISLMKHVI